MGEASVPRYFEIVAVNCVQFSPQFAAALSAPLRKYLIWLESLPRK
jgi:hypothetical protein